MYANSYRTETIFKVDMSIIPIASLYVCVSPSFFLSLYSLVIYRYKWDYTASCLVRIRTCPCCWIYQECFLLVTRCNSLYSLVYGHLKYFQFWQIAMLLLVFICKALYGQISSCPLFISLEMA